jgi:penicillin-binding protein 1C
VDFAHRLNMLADLPLRWLRRWQNVLVGLALLAAVLLACRLWPHPPLRDRLPSSTAVYDDRGRLLRLTLASDDRYRLWVPLAQIAPSLTEGVLLHEDRWFRWHPGFNPYGLLRGAWVTYARHGHPQGGSTISMQLARLLWHLDTRTPLGKLRQIARAVQLELCYSKHAILEAYLNAAPYGGNVEGVVLGEAVERHGVRIIGLADGASRLAVDASNLFARNCYIFIEAVWNKGEKTLAMPADDALVEAVLLTKE